MDDEEYNGYIDRAEFFNATGRTVEGLHGMLFRKPVIAEVPDNLAYLLDNVDGKGNDLHQFINDTGWDALQTGWGGVLVDAPQNGNEVVSQADYENAELSAYMTLYKAEQIINWRFKTIGRKQKLELVVLEEEVNKKMTDEFNYTVVKYHRVLKLDENGKYEQILYDDHDTIIDKRNPTVKGKEIDYLPFFLLPSKEPEKPICLDLVNVNLAWYRKSADLENGAHWTGVPTPYCLGYEPETQYDEEGNEIARDPIKLGGGKMLAFPTGVTAVNYLEFRGSGLGILQSMMSHDEERMAILGARIISAERKGVESAETAKIHRAGENSVLASFAVSLSRVFTDVVTEYLKWASNEENPEVNITINTDYDVANMTPAELTALVSLWQSGGIPKTVLFDNLREGEIIKGDMSFDDLQAEIQEEQNVAMQSQLAMLQAQTNIENQAQ